MNIICRRCRKNIPNELIEKPDGNIRVRLDCHGVGASVDLFWDEWMFKMKTWAGVAADLDKDPVTIFDSALLPDDRNETTQATPEPILRFFGYEHLPPHLQETSKKFHTLAMGLMELPRNAERSVALRKLLESKDAAVRAAMPEEKKV